MSELKRLETIAENPLYAAGVNSDMVEYSYRVFARHMRNGATLELGPAEGVMTDRLARRAGHLTVVEGSATFCNQLRNRHPGITVVNALFENFEPKRKFDNILLGHVLEHVEDANQILERCRSWLNKGGVLLAAVPNSRSLHRQAAVLMGLLPYESAMNEADRQHGHRRVFDPESFRRCFNKARFSVEMFGGYWLKPVSNAQIATDWTPAMIQAFMQLGERYPDIAAEIYVVAAAA